VDESALWLSVSTDVYDLNLPESLRARRGLTHMHSELLERFWELLNERHDVKIYVWGFYCGIDAHFNTLDGISTANAFS
jgi:hypothetical protein